MIEISQKKDLVTLQDEINSYAYELNRRKEL
jgi:hypothetical protein